MYVLKCLKAVPLYFRSDSRAVTFESGAAILNYLASEVWGEEKTTLASLWPDDLNGIK